MDVFDEAKARLTMRDVVQGYGFVPTRAGFICCPFHSERTPSMKLYNKRFHCFGCGAHGTVIDFVAKLFNLTPLDAVKKLDKDFDLHLTYELPNGEERERRRRVREVRQLFDEWREQTVRMFDAVIRVANLANYEELSDAETVAIRYREAFEYWADILLSGPLHEQMAIFRDRKEVERLCRMVLNNMPGRSKTA